MEGQRNMTSEEEVYEEEHILFGFRFLKNII